MAEETMQVTEAMADFIEWANEKGQDEVRRMVREHLAELKEKSEKSKGAHNEDEPAWDKVLEPNDGVDQWKQGGDCNLCRKIDYCGTKCRANRLLKKIITPFLYNKYLEEHPEAAAKNMKNLDTETLMKQAGVLQ